METSNRLSHPDRLEIFGNDWDDRDDPDDHMETRLNVVHYPKILWSVRTEFCQSIDQSPCPQSIFRTNWPVTEKGNFPNNEVSPLLHK